MTLDNYLLARYSQQTAKAYGREIKIYRNNFQWADKAVYKDITGYIGLLRRRYSKAATISRIVASIKVYYDYLCSEDVRSDNPAGAIRLKDKQSRDVQLQDLLSVEELEGLMNRKERYSNLDYRNKVLISLLIYQGLHPGEMEMITLQDIDLGAGSIYIRSTPKTNSRTLWLRPAQILLLHHYITQIRPKLLGQHESAALLIGIRGGLMKAEDITKHVKRSFKQVYPGRKVNAQTIRQSVVANLFKAGHDISVVQAFAGHKYPSATQRYRQQGTETLQAAVNRYHPFT